jgi:hypothetical protein
MKICGNQRCRAVQDDDFLGSCPTCGRPATKGSSSGLTPEQMESRLRSQGGGLGTHTTTPQISADAVPADHARRVASILFGDE